MRGISKRYSGDCRSYRIVTHDVKRKVANFTPSPIEAPKGTENRRTPRISGVPRRIGVFGGTFDPPHNGHLAVAAVAREGLGLDLVLLTVANDPWKKSPQRDVTPAADRLAMVEALVRAADGQALPGLVASDLEIRRGGPSYTVDTLRELAQREPDATLFLIVGRDLAAELPSWHEAAAIEQLATVVVVDRPGFYGELRANWRALHVEPVDVSSSQLRQLLRDGGDVSAYVPPGVIDVIQTRGLYGMKASA